METKNIYTDLYKVDGHNYSGYDPSIVFIPSKSRHFLMITDYLNRYSIGHTLKVLEIGAALGNQHSCHPNWLGIEYSSTAVELARKIHGEKLNIHEGDARKLPFEKDSIDFIFSIDTLEHVPNVEIAFNEIIRVLKPKGIAVLSPAWNCRSWTVKKLEQRPYCELEFFEKIEKLLIPIRNSIVFRATTQLFTRFLLELKYSFLPVKLVYKKLTPRFDLLKKYHHISDDDAFISIDSHSALIYFRKLKFNMISHPSLIKQMLARGEEIVIQKP